MKQYLFSYGTLQNEEVQFELFGRILSRAKDSLKGHKTCSTEITDESFLSKGGQKQQLTAIISNDKNDMIYGTVFEICEEELRLVDKYEPDGYERARVRLESGKQAWIYRVTID